jgi:hypothetical protein
VSLSYFSVKKLTTNLFKTEKNLPLTVCYPIKT